MITLYSGPLSLFTAKVRIALDEKGIDYERVEVPFDRANGYEPKHPEVVRYNPKQQVPVFVDTGAGSEDPVVLFDSTVILEYLEDIHPDPALYPTDARARARCRMLELHADEVFFPNVLTLIREVFYAGHRENESIGEAQAALARHYAELDATLASRDWIGGDEMTVADLTYRLATLFAASLGTPPPALQANLQAWLARIDARPSVARELEGLMKAVADISAPAAS